MASSAGTPLVRRLLLAAGLLAAIWVVVGALSFTRFWQSVELKGFDQLTVLTAPGKSTLPITIVGIDEASFANIGLRWPWPRSLYGKLVDRLHEGGAAVIAFDMIFAETSEPAEDRAFAKAIKRAGNVVMSADHAYQETATLRQWIRVEPLPMFKEAGVAPGLATVTLDGDAVVRQLPHAADIFWAQTIRTLLKTRPGLLDEPQMPPGAMVRHLGPAHTFPYVSFHQVLNGDPTIPPDFFKDQIVLIGRDVRASPEAGAAQADMFATPFLGVSQLLTPGVEIHATIIENALAGQAILPLGQGMALMVLTAALLLALPSLVRWHPVWSGVWHLALLAAVTALAYGLFGQRNQWLPVAATLMAIVLSYVSMGLSSYILERRRGQQIKGAFAKYVSSEVVDQMIAHPEKLRLGGERRELTLIFSDLAGFTSISEKLPPDGVAKVINAYLTEMTRVILSERGTVDKFIGDAVMAFWGAPLDDAEHALHAVRSAIAMQEAMDGLQASYREMGLSNVGLRIGVNSGPAIVGNMGSEDRFDYTALGDAVNLASRLEGVNKMYGTRILVSETTVKLLGGAIKLRLVDRVRVKGKDEPVEIYTPCDDDELIARSRAALDAYRAQDWPAARKAWARVQEHAPNDPVAKVFLHRIEDFEQQPPEEHPKGSGAWDGSVALEKG
jgi:adenylate cyclase